MQSGYLRKDLSSTYTARNITYDGFARPSYDLVIQGETVSRITLGVTGEHNVYNSLAAIAIALELGVGFDAIMSGLGRFTGTDRRFEKKGEVAGVTVIDDYAHHPQEIKGNPGGGPELSSQEAVVRVPAPYLYQDRHSWTSLRSSVRRG